MIGRYITRLVTKDAKKILDLGCGSGIERLNGEQEIDGLDLFAQKPIHYDKFIKFNLEKGLPVSWKKPGHYDVVIIRDVLEHIHNPLEILRMAYDQVKNGGKLLVKVPDYRSKNAWGDYTHIRPYTKGAISQMVKDAGFNVKKVVRLGGYLLPNIIPQPFSWMLVAEK